MFATGRTRRLLAEVSLRCKFDAAESTMELVSYGLNPKTNLEGIHSMFHLQELKRRNNVSYRGLL